MSQLTFRITRTQIDLVLTWLTMLEQARVALELEDAGHEVICLTLQKTTETIAKIFSELPAA